jgi:hypothetical protein
MLELIITSHYLIVDSEVQLFPYQSRRKFPQFLKNVTTNRKKGEYEEGGGKGWELILCLRIDSVLNPSPELTETPL